MIESLLLFPKFPIIQAFASDLYNDLLIGPFSMLKLDKSNKYTHRATTTKKSSDY